MQSPQPVAPCEAQHPARLLVVHVDTAAPPPPFQSALVADTADTAANADVDVDIDSVEVGDGRDYNADCEEDPWYDDEFRSFTYRGQSLRSQSATSSRAANSYNSGKSTVEGHHYSKLTIRRARNLHWACVPYRRYQQVRGVEGFGDGPYEIGHKQVPFPWVTRNRFDIDGIPYMHPRLLQPRPYNAPRPH